MLYKCCKFLNIKSVDCPGLIATLANVYNICMIYDNCLHRLRSCVLSFSWSIVLIWIIYCDIFKIFYIELIIEVYTYTYVLRDLNRVDKLYFAQP